MAGDVTDLFHQIRARNQFDRMEVRADELYDAFPVERAAAWQVPPPQRGYGRLYRAPWLPPGVRRRTWQLLRRLRLDQRWFDEFALYWASVLGGRHLFGVEDFHFLRGVYRIRHQDNQVPDTDNPRTHLEAWQQPELIYQLFQQAMVESINPQLSICTAIRAHLKRPLGALLEFGCASAPIVTSYLEFFGPATTARFFVSDIQTLSFHYAAFKFRRRPNVIPRLLKPEDQFAVSVDCQVDVVCCMQVFEHLQEPRRVVQQLAGIRLRSRRRRRARHATGRRGARRRPRLHRTTFRSRGRADERRSHDHARRREEAMIRGCRLG
jgi:hypothetical protein